MSVDGRKKGVESNQAESWPPVNLGSRLADDLFQCQRYSNALCKAIVGKLDARKGGRNSRNAGFFAL